MYQKQDSKLVKHLDFLVLDILVLEMSYIFSYIIRHGMGEFHTDSAYLLMAGVLLMIQFFVVVFGESYKDILRRDYLIELKRVIVQNTCVIVLVFTFMFFTKMQMVYSRLVFVQLWIISICLIYGERLFWKNVVRKKMRNSDERSKMLVISRCDTLEASIGHLQEKNTSHI